MLGVVLAGLLLAAVLAAVVLAVRLTHRDEVLPGTRMAGISLGGATETEARRRLAALEAEDAPLALTTGSRVVRLRPSAAGYDLDERASARRAMRSGREGRLGGAWTTLKGLFTARDVPVVARIDRARLRDAVAGVAGRLDRPASVGALRIDDATLAVGVRSAPRQGREVDRRRLAKLVRAALRSDRQRVVIHVPLERTPAVSRARVRELAAAAEAYLQTAAAPRRRRGRRGALAPAAGAARRAAARRRRRGRPARRPGRPHPRARRSAGGAGRALTALGAAVGARAAGRLRPQGRRVLAAASRAGARARRPGRPRASIRPRSRGRSTRRSAPGATPHRSAPSRSRRA